jgi:hypothetical protein
MQTGTAAFGNVHSKALVRIFWSPRKQILELPNSAIRNVNHRWEKYGCEVFKSK